MPRTLGDVFQEAERRYAAKDFFGALKVYRMIFGAAPPGGDVDIRLRIADTLLALGEETAAKRVYVAVATQSIRAGLPLYAVVAIKILERLNVNVQPAVEALAETYAEGSDRIGRGARPAPLDLDQAVLDDVSLDYPAPLPALVQDCIDTAGAVDAAARFPDKVPGIPLFSLLPAGTFMDVIRLIGLRRCGPNETVIREGETGEAFYVVARGTIRISQQTDTLPRELARLADGSVFGEMALISNSPRTASVTTVGPADLLEFDREALTAAADRLIEIATALDRFTRERLVQNVLATNPLFRPFDRNQRLELLRRFSAHELVPGTVIVREAQEGKGLYLILTGEVSVTKRGDDGDVHLATLKAGDLFGEISLVKQCGTTATVTAVRHTTILFLPRAAFVRLVEALPELATYFRELTEERLMDTRLLLEQGADTDAATADMRHLV
jgi:CRP-like cAMP-binding protein